MTNEVVPFNNSLCWDDYSHGFLFCDGILGDDGPKVSYVRFPQDSFLRDHILLACIYGHAARARRPSPRPVFLARPSPAWPGCETGLGWHGLEEQAVPGPYPRHVGRHGMARWRPGLPTPRDRAPSSPPRLPLTLSHFLVSLVAAPLSHTRCEQHRYSRLRLASLLSLAPSLRS